MFKARVRVLYGDTDAGGVVYNANFLRYFEIGRTELMREHVCSYSEIEKLGFVLPVIECWARYKAPAFYDDLLTVETTVAEVSDLKCKFAYRIVRQGKDTDRPKLLVKGYTVHAAVTKEGKLTRLPDEIIEKIKQLTSR
ncbi:MAG: thioesterase [Desulfobulbaceae bacterium S3730MH12]|nr:MAG: thioesterase [Desulfobulbaceae bacterium S5133MH15]OEU55008.1 MAG: thioesterase [Desulfobulbaceae bacterium S3730MH12]OEU78642.1 MAG: thioesterase [Desulfobulbaceae bacterium C00003063]